MSKKNHNPMRSLKRENPGTAEEVRRILNPKDLKLGLSPNIWTPEQNSTSTSQKLISAEKSEKFQQALQARRGDNMIRLGLDLGTKTIVLARRKENLEPAFKHEINGFYEFSKPDQFTKNLLVNQKIPFVERNGKFYALGSKAEKLAYAFNGTLRRPMADGTLSGEEEAINIMASIVQAIIGKLDEDALIYYCIPADAINKSTNVQFHNKIAQLIIESYRKSEASIRAYPINEARALAVGSGKDLAIAISFGAGMVNVCYCMFGMTVFEFSLVGSGDWIDIQSAMRFGYDPKDPGKESRESPTTVCRRKEEIDLTKSASELENIVDKTVVLHYQILIENVVKGIINGFNKNIDKARIEQAIPIIIAGGTASPAGFGEYFEKILRQQTLPFEVSEVIVHPRPLFAVAEGCLVAAELHGD